MNLTLAGNGKYLFHKKIESGDFSIFDGDIDKSTIFSTYFPLTANSEIDEYKANTTFRSLLAYLNKNADPNQPEKSLEDWEYIKSLNFDFSLVLDDFCKYAYFQHLEPQKMVSIPVDLSHFNTLISFGFLKKSQFLANHMFKEFFDKVDLSRTHPIFVINSLHFYPHDIINLYFDKIKERHPEMSLEYGLNSIDFNIFSDKDTLKHFISLYLRNHNDFTDNIIAQTFLHFKREEAFSIMQNFKQDMTSLFKNTFNIINNNEVNNILSNNQALNNLLDYVEVKKISLNNLKTSDFLNFAHDNELMLRLIKNGVQYKPDFEKYVYELNNAKNNELTLIDFFIKNNLWAFETSDDKGRTFTDYFNAIFNDFYMQSLEGFANKIHNEKNARIADFNIAFEFFSKHPKTKPQSLDFLKHKNKELQNLFFYNIFTSDYIERQHLEKFLKTDDFVQFLIEATDTQKDRTVKFLQNMILSHDKEKLNFSYFTLTEEQYDDKIKFIKEKTPHEFLNNGARLDLLNIILMANKDKNYIEKNIEDLYSLFLQENINILHKHSHFRKDHFIQIQNLFNDIDSNIIFYNKSIGQTYLNLINTDIDAVNKYMRSHEVAEIKEYFSLLKEEHLQKHVAYEKQIIKDSLSSPNDIKVKNKRL